MTTAITRSTMLRLSLMLSIAFGSVVSTGCGGDDSASIEALEALNAKLVAEGGSKAVRMQKNGSTIGTIYIMSNVDDVMPHIAKLRNVEEIYFHDSGFRDEHVKFVSGLSSLNSLVISGTEITDAGVAQLTNLNLQALFLDGTAITSASLEPISKMSTLLSLDLTGTKVQDNLTPLKELPNLEWLLLRDMDLSGLSEQSIQALLAMPNLSRFTVTNTNISNDLIKRLKAAKPALNLETSAAEEPPVGPVGGAPAAEQLENDA